MAAVSDQDMSAMLTAHTNRYQNEFQPLNALNELYFCYASTYKSQVRYSLGSEIWIKYFLILNNYCKQTLLK